MDEPEPVERSQGGTIRNGEATSAAQLLPLVYAELRKLAKNRLLHEGAGHTLQPTALVHEAYVRLISSSADKNWNGRRHFFGAAAEAMRRVLVDHARRKHSLKRGGEWRLPEPEGEDE